jgi:hypothetical protein
MTPALRQFRYRLGRRLVFIAELLTKLLSVLIPQVREPRSQRMCPFCGLITPRHRTSCMECGKSLRPA